MSNEHSRDVLMRTVASARRRLFFQSCMRNVVNAGLVLLPVAAVSVALDQWLASGQWSVAIAGGAAGAWILASLLFAWARLRTPLDSALALDEGAALKDRLSTAWEFLSDSAELDEPKVLQIRDALRHAESLNVGRALHQRLPRYALAIPVLLALVAVSFFMPSRFSPSVAEAAVDQRKAQQLDELRQLSDDLMAQGTENEELEKVLENLKEIERRFKQGEMAERDVMIELARLDEDLRQSLKQAGVENLQNELNQLVPHLMAAEATKAVAMALKEQQLDKAAQEMDELGKKERAKELSEKDKEQLAMNMGVAAAKLGSKQKGSFGGDMANASEAMKSGDSDKFCDACTSAGNKMSSVSKYKKMSQAQKRIGMAKLNLGQKKECKACSGGGCAKCNGSGKGEQGKEGGYGDGEGKGKGGLKAGKGATGDPFGDPSRLAASYRNMLEVKGTAGDGPVDSEVEVTEGQTSESQIGATDVYAEYAAVAEEAIEKEEIPLSHRFHVKRYFQAIRPTE
ncbi:MAG: hypothetical protein AMXMBFR84_28170 [Candidatus Hydrogenedentota bacterium]